MVFIPRSLPICPLFTVLQMMEGSGQGAGNKARLWYHYGMVWLVSQATPFAERGRVWSHCNY